MIDEQTQSDFLERQFEQVVQKSGMLVVINSNRISHDCQESEEFDVSQLFSGPRHLFCEGISTSQLGTPRGTG